MKDRIALEEPAGLCVYQVLEGTAGNGAEPIANDILAHYVHGACLIDGKERISRADLDGLSERSNVHRMANWVGMEERISMEDWTEANPLRRIWSR